MDIPSDMLTEIALAIMAIISTAFMAKYKNKTGVATNKAIQIRELVDSVTDSMKDGKLTIEEARLLKKQLCIVMRD